MHYSRAEMPDDVGMPRSLKTYDHRLRELARQTGDVTIATSAGVPRSTAAGWLRRPGRSTVTLDALSMDQQTLQTEVLRGKLEKLRAVARILVASMKALATGALDRVMEVRLEAVDQEAALVEARQGWSARRCSRGSCL